MYKYFRSLTIIKCQCHKLTHMPIFVPYKLRYKSFPSVIMYYFSTLRHMKQFGGSSTSIENNLAPIGELLSGTHNVGISKSLILK